MRRRTLLGAATLAAAPALAQPMLPQLSIFVPANPGGGWDGLARAIEQVTRAEGLAGRVALEHAAGAGGTVGLPRFVQQRRGRADSLFVGGTALVGAAITNRSPLTLADLPPVARLTEEAGVIVAPMGEGHFTDIAALLAALRDDPGAVPVAGAGGGTPDHVTLGLLLRVLGRPAVQARLVAFPGGGAQQAAVVGGQVRASVAGWGEYEQLIRAGRLRALATTGATRTDPTVPTLREAGLDVVVTNWRGVFAAPGTRPEAMVALMQAMHRAPAWGALLRERGWADAFLTGAEFADFLRSDRAQTRAVLEELGLA
jgi:putative tricarboxylic transport membrane protein